MNQKPSEAGWFYHAPAKKAEHVEPVGAPPASQIPGLGDISVLPREQPKEMLFRDTDSKYIRLAKMGGRKDLLVIRPNSGTKKEPKSYPRNDWFYLEDNAQQAKEQQDKEQEPWKFLLPEYMVYESKGETTAPEECHTVPKGPTVPMRPAPFAVDQKSPKVKNDLGKPLKTNRHSNKVRMAKTTSRKEPISTEMEDGRPLKYQPLPAEQEEPTSMAKLLAYSYEREWHDKHRRWEEKQDSDRKKTVPMKSFELSKSDNKSGRQTDSDANNNHVVASPNPEEGKKEPFKLSKFKKVPARLETRRSMNGPLAKGK